MRAENLSQLCTWVGSTYLVHQNIKSHTSGEILLNKGLVNYQSIKQNLNTKSYTESEVVGVSD